MFIVSGFPPYTYALLGARRPIAAVSDGLTRSARYPAVSEDKAPEVKKTTW